MGVTNPRTRRPLAPKTLTLQRTHLRLAASILVKNGTPVAAITALAQLAEPEALKTVRGGGGSTCYRARMTSPPAQGSAAPSC